MSNLHLLDFVGAFFAFIATCFFIRANPLAWPISLIAISTDIFLYWHKGIYGDTGLQIIYLIMTSYGWWQWLYGGEKHSTLPITRLKSRAAIILSCAALASIVGLTIFLKRHTNSAVPYWDATTTILSLAAQYLTCRKIIENWLVWLVTDILFAGLYFYKNIPIHATLQLIYLGMAIIGYISWKKNLEKYTHHESSAIS